MVLETLRKSGHFGRALQNLLIFSIALPCWLLFWQDYIKRQIRVPEIVGATDEDQRTLVPRFFYLGRQFRHTLCNTHAVSWYDAANIYENGDTWSRVRDYWSRTAQADRDEPFRKIVEPELRRITPLDQGPDPEQRRRGAVALKAFSAGLDSL